MKTRLSTRSGFWLWLGLTCLATAVYLPGLWGGWLMDDYSNIIHNPGVQPKTANLTTLTHAALSLSSGPLKRPLASLSFAMNYLANGLDPWGWKVVNLLIHLLNGLLIYILTKHLLRAASLQQITRQTVHEQPYIPLLAAWIAGSWLLLPINITAVLYVVQRMESMANVFVLLGLTGYLIARQRMRMPDLSRLDQTRHALYCAMSLITGTILGSLAKETAVMLPVYAFLIEWLVFRFKDHSSSGHTIDRRILGLFIVTLLLPMIIGLAWLPPNLSNPISWATRDFNIKTRLLSEARVVMDYIVWTLLPSPHALSFYHDDFKVSSGLLTPWTTLVCLFMLLAMVVIIMALRKRYPVVALGLSLFLACHLLTATVFPLELVFEHRNYFASFGLVLTIVPVLAPVEPRARWQLPRGILLIGLLVLWTNQTLLTSLAWNTPLKMTESLASRRPTSVRAQYDLGRAYLILSNGDPNSMFTKRALVTLELAATLPHASILPEQALIFMTAHMHRPVKARWWDSLIRKLRIHPPGTESVSALGFLTHCACAGSCVLSKSRMKQAFHTALAHPHPDADLLEMYSDYAWHVLQDRRLALHLNQAAVASQPNEGIYRIALIKMLIRMGKKRQARQALHPLERLNITGRFNEELRQLRMLANVK